MSLQFCSIKIEPDLFSRNTRTHLKLEKHAAMNKQSARVTFRAFLRLIQMRKKATKQDGRHFLNKVLRSSTVFAVACTIRCTKLVYPRSVASITTGEWNYFLISVYFWRWSNFRDDEPRQSWNLNYGTGGYLKFWLEIFELSENLVKFFPPTSVHSESLIRFFLLRKEGGVQWG